MVEDARLKQKRWNAAYKEGYDVVRLVHPESKKGFLIKNEITKFCDENGIEISSRQFSPLEGLETTIIHSPNCAWCKTSIKHLGDDIKEIKMVDIKDQSEYDGPVPFFMSHVTETETLGAVNSALKLSNSLQSYKLPVRVSVKNKAKATQTYDGKNKGEDIMVWLSFFF